MPQSIKPKNLKNASQKNVCAFSAVHTAFVISAVSDENKAMLYKRELPLPLE